MYKLIVTSGDRTEEFRFASRPKAVEQAVQRLKRASDDIVVQIEDKVGIVFDHGQLVRTSAALSSF
jgi:hypothetical protein